MALRGSRITRKLNPGVYARPDGKMQAHIPIPADVRFAYGGRQKLVRSLHTDDAATANIRHAQLVAEMEAGFDLLRRGTTSKAFESFALKLHESQRQLIATGNDRVMTSDIADAQNHYLSRSFGERLFRAHGEELEATVGWAADWFFAEQMGVEPESLSAELRSSLIYKQMLRECAEVLKDSWREGRERLEGQIPSPPQYPALKATPDESPDGNRATDDRATWSLSDYHEKVYLPAKTGEIQAHTAKVKRYSVQLFRDLVGDPPLFMVTRAQLGDYQDQLKLLPDLRRLTGDLAKMSVREIVARQRSGALDLPRTSATTINKHVLNLKAVLAYAQGRGHMRLNPSMGMDNLQPTDANPVTERRPFTRLELEAIFSHPLFAGCAEDSHRGFSRPGPVKIRDERFWIPMLLFLTGARAAEIAGLEKADVKIADGMARIVFRYTAVRRLKNRESERVIPLHPWALKMGFEEYVTGLPAETPYLFPAVVAATRDRDTGQMKEAGVNGASVFRQFNRSVLKHLGLEDDPSVSLHSFRHTFEEAMTGRDIPEEVMFRLTGRTVGGSCRIYTKSLPLDEESRDHRSKDYMRHVERIDFGGANISSLFI